MIKNVIFDMGGVIVDVHLDRAIRNFKALGVGNAAELLDSYHHKGIFIDVENGSIDADEFCRMLCLQVGHDVPRAEIEHAWRSIIDPPAEYKLQYIAHLRLTRKVYLLTNNNPIIMDWACVPGFTSSGAALSDYFDRLYISCLMKTTKPGLRIYQMMIEDAGLIPSESLFIDDSSLNIQAAAQCGLQTLLVGNTADWRTDVDKILL
ncbi:MAG: HAD family phosphatase [Tannerella sp.]|jgi:putative hydrolase of the HAD superfamily|nr:HAD family phosphatase [Tannerella sp.]